MKKTTSFLLIFTLFLSSCGLLPVYRSEGPLAKSPTVNHSCNIQANIDSEFQDIKYAREDAGIITRVGVMPFFVPESFSDFGEKIALSFVQELQRSGEFQIVEYFRHGNWKEHKEDYFQGNLQAIRIANDAGYNTLVVGLIDENVSGRTHVLHTKLIDVSTAITLWSGTTEITSSKPVTDTVSEFFQLKREVPNVFDFGGVATEMARCSVQEGFLGNVAVGRARMR